MYSYTYNAYIYIDRYTHLHKRDIFNLYAELMFPKKKSNPFQLPHTHPHPIFYHSVLLGCIFPGPDTLLSPLDCLQKSLIAHPLERGENAVLHQEQPSLFPLASLLSNYISKVHVVGKPEWITVLRADQEGGLKTGRVGRGVRRWQS